MTLVPVGHATLVLAVLRTLAQVARLMLAPVGRAMLGREVHLMLAPVDVLMLALEDHLMPDRVVLPILALVARRTLDLVGHATPALEDHVIHVPGVDGIAHPFVDNSKSTMRKIKVGKFWSM